MKIIAKAVTMIAFVGWVGTASATPIVTSDGVWGLEVGGSVYDIEIGNMGGATAGAVYAGYGLTAVPNPVLVAINTALIALFNAPPAPHAPGPLPVTFFDGCGSIVNCVVFLPTYLSGPNPATSHLPVSISTAWIQSSIGLSPSTRASITPNLTFGVVNAKVPLPGTLALFGLGLAGLGMRRHKRARWNLGPNLGSE